MTARQFFHRKPAAVVIIILMVLYGVFAPLNIFLGNVAAQRGDQQVSHALYVGAFWNAVVAMLCFIGWRLMRRQSRASLAGCACAIAAALFIVMRTWVGGLLHGQNPFPLIEAVLTWLPMLYAIIFALRESKRQNAG